jgi:hypothetical protein
MRPLQNVGCDTCLTLARLGGTVKISHQLPGLSNCPKLSDNTRFKTVE